MHIVLVQCPAPRNSVLQCPNGATGRYGDTCRFSCNPGYELRGSQTARCLADKIWSGTIRSPYCILQECPDRILTPNGKVNLDVCSLEYLSRCILSCRDGFIGDSVNYLCNLTKSTTLDWIPIGGEHASCERGLSMSTNHCIISTPHID